MYETIHWCSFILQEIESRMLLQGKSLFGRKVFVLGEDPEEARVEVRLITWGEEGRRRILASSPRLLVRLKQENPPA